MIIMEIQEFVKSMLIDISEGVRLADKDNVYQHFHLPSGSENLIDFDLAVVLNKKGEMGIATQMFGFGGGISKETTNRIKFRVNTWGKSNAPKDK